MINYIPHQIGQTQLVCPILLPKSQLGGNYHEKNYEYTRTHKPPLQNGRG